MPGSIRAMFARVCHNVEPLLVQPFLVNDKAAMKIESGVNAGLPLCFQAGQEQVLQEDASNVTSMTLQMVGD